MRVAFLSHGTLTEPNHRITVVGLMSGLAAHGVATAYAEPTLTPRPDLLFAIHDVALDTAAVQATLSTAKAQQIPIAFWVNDLEPQHHDRLLKILTLADLLVVPTPLHAAVLRSLTSVPVVVAEDLLDPAIGVPTRRRHADADTPPSVLWFGFPQSYDKSMMQWHPELLRLAAAGRIRYTVCSVNAFYGALTPNVEVRQYDSNTIGAELRRHDCCVLSHAPWDYQLSTYVKSENKLALAIAAGTPCVVSRTPAYVALLARVGLEDYAVTAPQELAACLERLTSAAEREAYLAHSWDYVVGYYSADAVARRLLTAIASHFGLDAP